MLGVAQHWSDRNFDGETQRFEIKFYNTQYEQVVSRVQGCVLGSLFPLILLAFIKQVCCTVQSLNDRRNGSRFTTYFTCRYQKKKFIGNSS